MSRYCIENHNGRWFIYVQETCVSDFHRVCDHGPGYETYEAAVASMRKLAAVDRREAAKAGV